MNLDVHLEHGGILVVNTAMGVLGRLVMRLVNFGDAFSECCISS